MNDSLYIYEFRSAHVVSVVIAPNVSTVREMMEEAGAIKKLGCVTADVHENESQRIVATDEHQGYV